MLSNEEVLPLASKAVARVCPLVIDHDCEY